MLINHPTVRQAAAGVQAAVQATHAKPAFSASGNAAYGLGPGGEGGPDARGPSEHRRAGRRPRPDDRATRRDDAAASLGGGRFAVDTYLVPGLILFSVLGLGPLVAARLGWVRHPFAPTAALVVGVGLLIWVAVEVAIIGYSNEPPMQVIYGILGAAIVLVAIRWLLSGGLPRLMESLHVGPTTAGLAPRATGSAVRLPIPRSAVPARPLPHPA